MHDFSELGLSKELLKVLPELNINQPSDIQQKAIPLLLEDLNDLIGLAQTGTGKTAAFGLPLLDLVDANVKRTQALILSPTRELGQQIAEQLLKFSKYLPKAKIEVVYGGAPIDKQIRALKKEPHIIVATPGRLLDLARRKSVNLTSVDYLVLDEADEMLNMGFKEDLDAILKLMPDSKNTWLFSATMASEIRRIASEYMNSPVEVSVSASQIVNKNITHQFVPAKRDDKTAVLMSFLDMDTEARSIVFCRTKNDTQNLARELMKEGYKADALHGDLSQAQRDKVMALFREEQLNILIATDVAARGIDVSDLSYVFHYALPDNYEYYTHRSGRTGRAGKKGVSLSLVTAHEKRKLKMLENKLKIEFEKVATPTVEQIKNKVALRWALKLSKVEVNESLFDEQIWNEVQAHFSTSDKEDLLKKLLTRELDRLKPRKIAKEPSERTKRNKKQEDRRRDRDKDRDFNKSTRSQSGSKSAHRMFINVGSVDGINKKDLSNFIADVAKLPGVSLIKNMELRDKFAYFSVDQKYSKKIVQSFKGIKIEGRSLRVNREDSK